MAGGGVRLEPDLGGRPHGAGRGGQKKRRSDSLYARLADYAAGQGADSGEGDLPDVQLNDQETAWRVWRLARAFDWKFPPDVLLRQDAALMDDLLQLETLWRRIEKQPSLAEGDAPNLIGAPD